MNKQLKLNPDGSVKSRSIEWTDYTWNPIAGCQHGCRWTMPDGSVAECYAETVAEGVARSAYPEGFEYHYWHPNLLDDPKSLKAPSRIFIGSMADMFGHWVPDEQINQILQVCRDTPRHTYQVLTKNAPRLLNFDFPPNVWVGASVPPSTMMGKPLSQKQQEAMLKRTLDILRYINVPVRWMSFEPLSWDVAPIVVQYRNAIQWAVIGAATNGNHIYQPDPLHVRRLMSALSLDTAIFFKGNLRGNPAVGVWLEQFPILSPATAQLPLF